MRWLRQLSGRQRRLLGLLVAIILGIGFLLGWMVWNSFQNIPIVSPLPTPTSGPTATPTIAPTATPTPIPSPTPTPFFETADAGLIARDVAAARGVLPRWEVPLTLIDNYDFSIVLYRRYVARPPFPLSDRLLLQSLGLWPAEGGDIQPDVVIQAQRAAALYFPEDAELYLRRDWQGSIAQQRLLVAYGFAHALADQYSDLARLQAESTSFDRRLALAALAEGDALIALWRYAGLEPGSAAADTFLAELTPATLPSWRGADVALVERLARLPLELGRDYALAIYEAEGLAGLDAALRRPPRTTAQILQPMLPVGAVSGVEPVSPALKKGWAITLTESVGAALTGITLDEWNYHANPELTAAIAATWNGDLLQAWQGPAGESVQLWQIVWNSSQQTVAFFSLMRELLPGRIAGPIEDTIAPAKLPAGRWWSGPAGAAFLRREGNRVWLVWGDDVAMVEAAAATLP